MVFPFLQNFLNTTENSRLEQTGIPTAEIQVVKNCRLRGVGTGALETATKIFLVNNTYEKSGDADKEGGSLLMGLKKFDPDSAVYLFGNGTHIPGGIHVDIGHVYIFDSEIDSLYMRQQPFETYLTDFRLENVIVRTGD